MAHSAASNNVLRPPTALIVGDETSTEDLPADLDRQTPDELRQLQWDLERELARAIIAAPKGSSRRAEVIRRGYDTITRVLARRCAAPDGALVMGLDQKQVRFVLKLLARQQAGGLAPSLFEIGYGCGVLLEHVHRQGYPVAGIEVSTVLRAEALRRLGGEHEQGLLLGDLVGAATSGLRQRFSLIYWNDVLEHIAPDEVRDYLQRIADLLRPGGQLVTITPNWHMRPSDITREIHPPRTTAAGLHLQEYTLGQVTELLGQAGFRPVTVPLCVLPGRVITLGGGLAGIKRLFEPCLEGMPFGLAELLCRGLGLSYTIATKPSARAAKDPC